MGARRPTPMQQLGFMAQMGIGLEGTCPSCGKVKRLDVAALAKTYGFETPYERVVWKMRCGCGYKGVIDIRKLMPRGAGDRAFYA